MLRQLSISNFALIENISIEPEEGLNVLSGETGAGKTILIGALGVLRGNRAQTDFIRKGEESACVEGFFLFNTPKEGIPDTGVALDFTEGVLLRREISTIGKNRCYINGRMVPLNLYAEVAACLLDIHGQNQEQSLLKPERQLELVDRYAKLDSDELKANVRSAYEKRQQCAKEIEFLEQAAMEANREVEFLSYQIEEIGQRKLQPGEEEELRAESMMLKNLDEISTRGMKAYSLLQDQGKSLDQIDEAIRALEKVAEYDVLFANSVETMQSTYYMLEEVARDINGFLQTMEYNEGRLNEVEERLGEINFLKKKYGTSIEEILNFQKEAEYRLEQLSNRDERIASLTRQLEEQDERYSNLSEKLSEARKKAGKEMGERITNRLRELSMTHAEMSVFMEKTVPSINGQDKALFLFSPNVGEGARPLARIASGGETSRIMLAIKTILAKDDDIDILVFDEVDTGVGGESLVAVARNLSELAREKQVFCVTHSPQLASFSDCHFRIFKNTVEGRTRTLVQKLNELERREEIHRMLGGHKIDGAEEQAGLMMESAKRMKTHVDA